MLPPSSTAAWFLIPAGRVDVAVQVVVLLNSSDDDSVSLPVDDPPATIT
jgi:hypothetical protein